MHIGKAGLCSEKERQSSHPLAESPVGQSPGMGQAEARRQDFFLTQDLLSVDFKQILKIIFKKVLIKSKLHYI